MREVHRGAQRMAADGSGQPGASCRSPALCSRSRFWAQRWSAVWPPLGSAVRASLVGTPAAAARSRCSAPPSHPTKPALSAATRAQSRLAPVAVGCASTSPCGRPAPPQRLRASQGGGERCGERCPCASSNEAEPGSRWAAWRGTSSPSENNPASATASTRRI
eukprot:SAG31_NODE_2131_length_6375_cov_5.937540_5_plen_163_part_00